MPTVVYPWKQVLWDIAIKQFRLDTDLAQYGDLEQITEKHFPSGFHGALFSAIASGSITPVNEVGLPIPKDSPEQLVDTAFVTPDSVNHWLERNGYAFQWAPEFSKERPPHTQRRQDEVILAAIQHLGLDPQNLKEQRYQPGDKSRVRELVRARSPELFHSDTVFDKAWERQRKIKRIGSP